MSCRLCFSSLTLNYPVTDPVASLLSEAVTMEMLGVQNMEPSRFRSLGRELCSQEVVTASVYSAALGRAEIWAERRNFSLCVLSSQGNSVAQLGWVY